MARWRKAAAPPLLRVRCLARTPSKLADIAHETGTLVQLHARTIEGGNPSRILAAVLKQGQRVVEQRCNGAPADDSYNSTHILRLARVRSGCPREFYHGSRSGGWTRFFDLPGSRRRLIRILLSGLLAAPTLRVSRDFF